MTIRHRWHTTAIHKRVSAVASVALQDAWDSLPDAVRVELLGCHAQDELDATITAVARHAIRDPTDSTSTLGEASWLFLPGNRAWRRPDEEDEPPARSHLATVVDVLGFLHGVLGADGEVEISTEHLGVE